jgi:methionine-rich copper-binding protein CopC
MRRLNFAALAAASALAILIAPPAFAHAKLVSSNPANKAAVAAPPKTIVLAFNEKLVAAFTKVELTMPEHGGMKVAAGSAPTSDGKGLVIKPARPLGDGEYKLVWSTASADGHKMSGEISFTVT